ncbi:hypothetical protein PPRY_a1091 [Pseudoalteromonas prydzensis ACAM 620]|nr:hypothetical protein [Pseudoalteromonas prydzensis ACAM 620]
MGTGLSVKLKAHLSEKSTVNLRYFADETHDTVAALSWYCGLKSY